MLKTLGLGWKKHHRLNAGVLLATHDPPRLTGIADRVLTLQKGKIHA